MIKKSGLHAHAAKNVQKAFVSSGLSYDLNSSVSSVQFWPSCKAQHPCSVPDSSLFSGSLEVSPFPIKSILCWALGLISLPFFCCQSHRYKNWQLRVGTSAPCSVWQLPTISLRVLLSQAWISGNPQTLQIGGKEMLQGRSFPLF